MAKQCMSLTYLDLLWILLLPLMFMQAVGNPIPQPWSGASSLNSSPSSDVQVALIERQKFSPLLIPVLVETVRKYGTEVGIPVFKKIAEGKPTKIEGTLIEQAKETGKAFLDYLRFGGQKEGKELATELLELSAHIQNNI